MPAPLKFTACTNCKAVRTKCDQLWPTCTQCVRKGIKCSGPSALIKFVGRGRGHTAASSDNALVLANTQDSPTHQPLFLVTRMPLRQYGVSNNGALSGAFRLKVPRPSFVTAADRVSGQLVHLLGSDLQATFAVLGELPELPQRLSHSPILLNCVTLYCHAWSQCADTQLRFHQLLKTSLYTKAIQGLQRAVQSENVYTLETLAAMVMMEFLLCKCNMVSPQDMRPHRLAIRHVVKKMGMPDPRSVNYWLHLSLIRITGFMMRNLAYFDNLDPSAYYDFPDDSRNDDREFVTQWLEDDQDGEWNEKTEVETTFELANDIWIVFTSRWCQRVRQIKANPSDMEHERALLVHRMSKAERFLWAMGETLWKRLQSNGSIIEHSDPDFFVSRRYEFTTYKVTRVAVHLVALRAFLLRVLFDLYSLVDVYDGAIYETYRGLCFQVWACLPHLKTVHALSAKDTLLMVVPLYEAADSDELRHLYDIKIDWTVFGLAEDMGIEAFQNWIVARSAQWI
uniref:Zn(2)-C6 fungal-type domain-containing protein n=1 Tax=Bionectria ochroleuca TaxID=29856 RepID=A0A8H7NQT0_BIOOC